MFLCFSTLPSMAHQVMKILSINVGFIELRIFIVVLHHFYIFSTPSNLRQWREGYLFYVLSLATLSLQPRVCPSSICLRRRVRRACNAVTFMSIIMLLTHSLRTSSSISSTNQIFLKRLFMLPQHISSYTDIRAVNKETVVSDETPTEQSNMLWQGVRSKLTIVPFKFLENCENVEIFKETPNKLSRYITSTPQQNLLIYFLLVESSQFLFPSRLIFPFNIN